MFRYLLVVPLALSLCNTAWAGDGNTIKELVSEAFALKDKGQFTEAIEKFESALNKSPKNEQALIGLGRTYGAKRDYKTAEKTFRKAIKHHPRSVSAHRYLSLTYLWTQQLAKAEKTAKKATKLAPKNWETFHSLAEIQITRRRWDAAIKSEKKVLKLDSRNLHACTGLIRAYQAKGKLKKASKYARKAADIAPKMMEPRIKLAELYAMQGKREKGIKTLKEAEPLLDGQIRRIAILATSFVLLGANDDAARLYSAFLKKNPDSAIGHSALAEVRVKQKKFDAAKRQAEKARKLDPKSPMPYQILGVVAALKKNNAETEKNYTKAIELASEPMRTRLRFELAMLFVEMQKAEKAIDEFEEILKKHPDANQISRPLCQLYRQVKRTSTRSRKVCLKACKEVSIAPKDCSIP